MKTFRLLLFVTGMLLGWQTSASAQSFAWAERDSGPAGPANPASRSFFGKTSAIDGTGNTYSAITMRDSVSGSPAVYSSRLAKFDAAGQLVWEQPLANIFIASGSMAVDKLSGGVFLSFFALSGASWGGTAVPSSTAMVIAKCAPTGSLVWQTPVPGLLSSKTTSDGAGNYYFTAPVQQATAVGGYTLAAGSTGLVQITNAGTLGWVQQVQASANARLDNLVLGAKAGSGCLLTGTLQGANVLLGYSAAAAAVISNTYGQQISFLINFDAGGTALFSRVIQLPATTLALNILSRASAADAAGNCYLTGSSYLTNTPNANAGFALAKYDAAGNRLWYRHESSRTSAPAAGTGLAVNNAGSRLALAVSVGTGLATSWLDRFLLAPQNSFLYYDGQGRALWMANDTSPGNQPGAVSGSYFSPEALGLDAQDDVYSTGLPYGTTAGAAALQFGSFTTTGFGVTLIKINGFNNRLTGRVYLDANANGQLDSGEGYFPQPQVMSIAQAGATQLQTSPTSSRYHIYMDSGSYAISLPNVPLHYTRTQPAASGYTGRFIGYGRADSLRHFGIAPVANQTDLRLTITPYGAARPGFVTRYRLTLENVGTTIVPAGTVTATLDPTMQYVASQPVASSQTGNTVVWNHAALAPFAVETYDVQFSLATNVVPGTVLNTSATAPATGDVVPVDNSPTQTQTVTSSFDPNDMAVNYSQLTPTQVAAAQPLDYTIRFQNLGTDTAFAVVLTDTLDFRRLNLNTMQLVAQSHNCLWSLTGPGLLTVRFINIKLPHRSVDVMRSQGFLRFRVQPRTSLVLGEIVPNHAHIYFDYNVPVRTNTATTTVMMPTALTSSHRAAAWTAYPNPATDIISLSADLATGGPVSIELLDALGRPVRRHTLAAPAGPLRQTLDVRDLAPGLYLVRLRLPDGTATSRPIVRN